MTDPAGIAIRFAVYLALLLAFGLSAMALIDRARLRRAMLAGSIVAGLIASGLSLVMLCAAMGGVSAFPVDRSLIGIVLRETTVGTSFIVRFAALGVALGALSLSRGRTLAVTLCTGIALASLAWAGHGAVHEGSARVVHLATTMVHLLAAGVWIGGIVVLLAGLSRPNGAAAMHRFSRTGAILVAVLAGTGVANLAFVVGPDGLTALPETTYGRLLLLKLAGFAAMLALAGGHRWYFVPRLMRAVDGTRASLRASMGAELAFGLSILAIVAWLGTVSPTP